MRADSTEESLYFPVFPREWTRSSLYSMAKWTNGLAFRSTQFTADGMPIIKIAEIKNGITKQTKFTNSTFDDDYLVQAGDLLFSWSGQPETSIDAFIWNGPSGWLNQHIFRVQPNSDLADGFFFQLLKYLRPNFVNIARNKQTTGLGHVTKRDLQAITIALPTLDEQKRIAHILGTLDDKIEINREMNRTLDELARTLFRSWFVDFDPVRAKMEGRQPEGMDAATAALFPDRLVDSELGPIPQGWEWTTVEDVVEINGSSIRASDEWESIRYIDISSTKEGEISEPTQYLKGEEPSRARRRLRHGDTALSTVRPDRRSYFLALDPDDDLIASTGFAVVTPQSVPWSFLHSALTLDSVFERLGSLADGGAYPAIRPNVIGSLPIAIPVRNLLDIYHQNAAPLFELASLNRAESRTLSNLRDTLLPELLTGGLDDGGKGVSK